MTAARPPARPATATKKGRAEQARRLAWLEAQAPLGWALILVLAALLGTIYLTQASRTAAMGRLAQVRQGALDDLKRENAVLARQIAEAQSLERLQARAVELGFVPAEATEIEYIVVRDYPVPAETPPPPAVVPPLPIPIESFRLAVWRAAGRTLTNLVRGEASEQ